MKEKAKTPENFRVVVVRVLPQEYSFIFCQRETFVQHQAKIGQVGLLTITHNIIEIRVEMDNAVLPQKRDCFVQVVEHPIDVFEILK